MTGAQPSGMAQLADSVCWPWPCGSWDASATTITSSWSRTSRTQQGVQAYSAHDWTGIEDLYGDDCSTLAESPGARGRAGDLGFLTHYQSDSLLPADSYTQPPPDYPLYNWTLPYGPDPVIRAPTPAATPTPITIPLPTPTHPSQLPQALLQLRQPHPSLGTRTNQWACGADRGQELCEGVVHAPASPCPDSVGSQSLSGILHGLDDDVVEVEVRTCRQDESSSSERVIFNSIEEALAAVEEQGRVDQQQQKQQQQPFHHQQQHQQQPLHHQHQHQRQFQASTRREATPSGARRSTPIHSPSVKNAAAGVGDRGLCLGDEQQEEVVKAAKSLFSKRTRTLYHWLYPETSKTKLKATVSAAWDTLAEEEKQLYLSQVLGRFGIQASSLMVNPQLDGIKGLPCPIPVLGPESLGAPVGFAEGHSLGQGYAAGTLTATASPPRPRGKAPDQRAQQDQEAVDQLFASCADSETWTSFSLSASSAQPKDLGATASAAAGTGLIAPPREQRKDCRDRRDRRKRPAALLSGDLAVSARAGTKLSALGLAGPGMVDEELTVLKRMRDARHETGLEEDGELSSELEKFRLLSSEGERAMGCHDDYWSGTPAPLPDDIFPQLGF